MWLRHLLSIAILPFTVAVLVPRWIARRYGVELGLGDGAVEWLVQIAGLGVLVLGLGFFAASLRRFVTEGRGTLAPWDPPRALVVRGPYRYVRNPMISGVVFVLFGEAMMLLSMPHFWWAAGFLAINLVYIPLVEEPQLEGRFGASYVEYCRNVPRVVPRLRPWEQTRRGRIESGAGAVHVAGTAPTERRPPGDACANAMEVILAPNVERGRGLSAGPDTTAAWLSWFIRRSIGARCCCAGSASS